MQCKVASIQDDVAHRCPCIPIDDRQILDGIGESCIDGENPVRSVSGDSELIDPRAMDVEGLIDGDRTGQLDGLPIERRGKCNRIAGTTIR